MKVEAILLNLVVIPCMAFQGPNARTAELTKLIPRRFLNVALSSQNKDYIYRGPQTTTYAPDQPSHLSNVGVPAATSLSVTSSTSSPSLSHARRSYFDIRNLVPKGPRKNPDVGQPHDSSRPLVKDIPSDKGTTTRSGSWWCASGGWPSPNLRGTTEIFYVFSGRGCLTDLDGTAHYFGPGDTVILPKGWSGRWDVLEDIHKVWFVVDHANVEDTSNPIRVVVTPYNELAAKHLQTPLGVRPDATIGEPFTTVKTVYDAGPTKVGSIICQPGSFPVADLSTTKGIHVLEGVFFLTDAATGETKKCIAGDTIVFPKGWSGTWDIIEEVRYLAVLVE